MKRQFNLSIVFGLLVSYILMGQTNYIPAPENLKSREWFQDAKFGLFIHWGIYSILGDGEWAMQQQKIDKKTYEKLASFFNPVEFDAKEWVSMAKNAGMKYITITTRHHDGFSMFDTKQSDWNIVQSTPYKKDIIKMLADECHAQDIKLFFYYSQVDWYHDDYYPRGWTGHNSGRPDSGDWINYLNFINAQLTELLTNYGEITGIWFDGYWDKKDADWQLEKTYQLIHKLQPQCMIGSNHHKAPIPGEDFQMFEKDLPGQNKAGFSGESEVGNLPLETCETMNHSWGFNLLDKNFKSTKEIIQYLVKAAGNNANFLLNVGPMPNGKIQSEFTSTLEKVGNWLKVNGESIYGTRGGPISPKPWGVTTQKGSKIYIHILNTDSPKIFIPDFKLGIKQIFMFGDGKSITYNQDKFGLVFQVPEDKIDAIDTIVVIEI